MAKSAATATQTPPSEVPSSSWSLEDIGRVNDQVEALGNAVNRIKELSEQLETRTLAIEKKTIHLDSADKLIPSEIISGLTPGQLYQTALSAAIIGQFLSKPNLMSQKGKYMTMTINDCLDFAYQTVQQQVQRIPAKAG